MMKQVKRKRLILAFLLVFLVTCFIATVALGEEAIKSYDQYPGAKSSLFPTIAGFEEFRIANYLWDGDGFWDKVDPFLIAGNFFQLISTFLVRLGIMILDFGQHPAFFDTLIEAILKKAQENIWGLFRFLIVLIAIPTIAFVIDDYRKGDFSKFGKRLITFLIGCLAFSIFVTIGADTIIKLTDSVGVLNNTISGKIVSSGSSNSGDNPEASFYNQIWTQMVVMPYETGEVGQHNFAINAKDAEAINKEIKPYTVKAGDSWSRVLSAFPTKSDERSAVLGVLKNNYKEQYNIAFSNGDRFVIGLVALLAGLCAFAFLAFFGALLIALLFYFVGVLGAGMIVIPWSFVPSEAPTTIVNYVKNLIAPLLSKLIIGIYMALVFFITGSLIEAIGDNTLGFIGVMFFLAVLFLLAIFAFFLLLKKLSNPVFSPLHKTLGGLKSGLGKARSSRRQRRQDRFYKAKTSRNRRRGQSDEDDDIDEQEDLDSSDEDNSDDGPGERGSKSHDVVEVAPPSRDQDSGARKRNVNSRQYELPGGSIPSRHIDTVSVPRSAPTGQQGRENHDHAAPPNGTTGKAIGTTDSRNPSEPSNTRSERVKASGDAIGGGTDAGAQGRQPKSSENDNRTSDGLDQTGKGVKAGEAVSLTGTGENKARGDSNDIVDPRERSSSLPNSEQPIRNPQSGNSESPTANRDGAAIAQKERTSSDTDEVRTADLSSNTRSPQQSSSAAHVATESKPVVPAIRSDVPAKSRDGTTTIQGDRQIIKENTAPEESTPKRKLPGAGQSAAKGAPPPVIRSRGRGEHNGDKEQDQEGSRGSSIKNDITE